MAGESAHVHLINNGPGGRPLERRVSLPIIRGGIHDHAFHCRRCISSFPTRCHPTVRFRHDDAAAIGIEQDLSGINSYSTPWIERTMGAKTIDLAGMKTGKENVPVVIRS